MAKKNEIPLPNPFQELFASIRAGDIAAETELFRLLTSHKDDLQISIATAQALKEILSWIGKPNFDPTINIEQLAARFRTIRSRRKADKYRKETALKRADPDHPTVHAENIAELAWIDSTPDKIAEDSELCEILAVCIDQLDEPTAKLLRQSIVEGISSTRLAEECGCSTYFIEKEVQAALNVLREWIKRRLGLEET